MKQVGLKVYVRGRSSPFLFPEATDFGYWSSFNLARVLARACWHGVC